MVKRTVLKFKNFRVERTFLEVLAFKLGLNAIRVKRIAPFNDFS